MSNAISELINVLRRLTQIIKVTPFFIVVLYMLTLIGYMFLSDTVIYLLDVSLYVSPLCAVVLCVLSKQVQLCFWHRLECMLPVVGMIPAVINNLVYPLTVIESYVNVILLIVTFLMSLINAYFVFIKPSVKKR